MKIKSWTKLILSILLAQSAGAIGSFFTISAIPTWYALLNKPVFSPPNWLFGPVWTILYTMIGISFYKIWINYKKENSWAIKFFLFHLFLNSIWSIIFFGIKNLGLAFFEIIIMWLTIIYMIIKFKTINKWASYLLIPYLFWVSFASILNFSVWRLNLNQNNINIFAQDLTSKKAFDDYVFSQDSYKESLGAFNLKRDSYQKNPTLSLKEEARVALYDFLIKRDDYKRTYLTLIRTKISESSGITKDERETVYTKIDPEVVWLEGRKSELKKDDSLENLLSKSKEEDLKYLKDTLPIIYFTLSNISLSSVIELKNSHIILYNKLKSEANDLVKLGRVDATLFDRWFNDIDAELTKFTDIENLARIEIQKIFSGESYVIKRSYEKSLSTLLPAKSNLLQLNQFISELELTISEKR
ncbi:MAG TPA: TspO/MBR family protein [Patescibacteria group bacterium]|nr:TspO/MBR family protein [Patescibacteria group bacterium]